MLNFRRCPYRWYFLLILLGLPASARGQTALERFEFQEPHMGSLFRIVLYAPDKATAEKASRAGFDRVEQLNQIMSDYKADSELMLLCKKFEKEIGEPVKISEELFTVLSQAQKISELSDGSFDVTVGAVVKLWRISRKTEKLPDPKALAEARKRVGWKNIHLDATNKTAKFLVPGMLLDLGGIAKGYAADEGLDALKKFGIDRAMLAASGDISVRGTPPDAPGWKIQIGKLTRKSENRVLLLKDQSVSTSGDAEQYVEIDGVRYSHIVDPKTGVGLIGHRSATVVAPKGILADSLTKMAIIQPPDKSLPILEKQPGVEVFLAVLENGQEKNFASKGFEKLLQK
ncbi:FAD:protein FMN transferase [Telmatocola sphagniphila]|uniref:FAD:protein FMN transferase n=1 Tax=Telmatocola sphagniphila TaxID=1123043 RepID=A0A8E6B3M4_9BACT|nr:FAD:protein FMN transferase [Telmatocola sphagniphila]QVL31111.1 FAD:protein FMN transferase [Telmatocola sphagniphila]